jgi:NodT family efflux transporter outer membrane factor (OMF) lipoprotein
MPDAWARELEAGLAVGEADLQTWWSALDDPVLHELLERAQEGNLDLRLAMERIREAQARRGIASSARVPSVDGVGEASRSRVSEGVTSAIPPPQGRTDNYYQAGFDAFWELDIWGRVAATVDSADAAVQASVEDYRDVLVLLLAETALTYLDVRTLQARLRVAHENVELQRATLKLTNDRYDSGISPELDVRQAELNLASTESVIPVLDTALARSMNRLGTLLAAPPAELLELLVTPSPLPAPPGEVVVGLPADLLRNRPDIRAAERALAAQHALIGVATADLYPQFSLLGTLSLQSVDGGDFLDSGSRAWGFGPSLRWSLFSGGRVRSAIDVEDARTAQALAAYERTVLLALEEVENALVAYAKERQRRDSLERAVTATRRSVELVEVLYKTGEADFLEVLDMQRVLTSQEDQLAESEGLVVQRLVLLYKALGGGWSVPAEPTATP